LYRQQVIDYLKLIKSIIVSTDDKMK